MARPDLNTLFDDYGNWSDVVVDLETRLEDESDEAARAELKTALAIVVLDQLENRDQAIELLEEAVDLDITATEAAERLADLYRLTEEWSALVGLHLDRVDHVSPDQRRALYVDSARVYAANLDQPEGAVLVLQKALLESPEDAALLTDAVEIVSTYGGSDDFAEFLQSRLAETADTRGEAATLPTVLAIGQLLLAQDRVDMAGIWFERALGIDDQHPDVHSALRRIYRTDESWTELAELLARIADDAMADDEAVAAWRELAAVAADHLGDPTAAAGALEKALARTDGDTDILDDLVALYEKSGDEARLVATLEARADSTEDPTARAALLVRIGNVRASGLDDAEGARRAWTRAFDLDPTEDGAWRPLLTAAADDVDTRLDLSRRRLESLTNDDGARRLDALVVRARACVEIDARDEAITTWRSVASLDPTHEEAIEALESLLRAAERFEDLAAWWRERAADAADDDETVRLLVLAADVYDKQLDDAAAALACLIRVLERRPHDAAALERTVALHRALDDDASALQALEALSALQGDAERVVSMLAMARMQRDANDATAVDTWRAVLALDPANREAIDGLVVWLEDREEWATVLEVLRHDASIERDLGRRASVFARMGVIRLDHRDDPIGAREDFEAALELDPDCIMAAMPLVDQLVEAGEWAPALPLLETLVIHHANADDATRALLHDQLAIANEALERTDDAIAHYTRTLEFDADNRDARFALARLLERAERWEPAADQWSSIVAEYAILLDEDDQVDTYWRAGRAASRAGDTERARRYLNSALAIDEWHEGALKDLATLDGDGAKHRTFEAKQRLLELTDDPGERFQLLVEMGDIADVADDTAAAVASWRAALELDGQSRVVLHKLLDLFTRTEQWRRSAEVLGRLSELENDPERRIKLLFAVAALFRDQLEELEQATSFFNVVLDADPGRLEAFEAIDHMLARAGMWDALEREYRRMLERVSTGEDTLRVHLFRNLARIYAEKMDRPDDAIAALQGALAVSPDEPEILEAIAAIEPTGGKSDAQIIAEHNAIIAVRPDRASSWHALFAAHERQREFDRAWRIAGLLETMNAAEPDERAFYREHRPRTLPMAMGSLDDADMRLIQHPAMDLLLTRLFATLAISARRRFARPAKDFGVDPTTDLVDLSRHHPITDLVTYALDAVGAPRPDVYVRTGASGLLHAGMDTPGVLLGDDIISATPNRQLVFRLGRMAFLCRTEVQMGAMYPSTDALKTFVYGALGLFTGAIVPQPSEDAVRGVVDQLGRMSKTDLEALGGVVQGMIQSNANPDVSTWLRGVEFTANRVGLLLCGDVRRAVEAVRNESTRLGRTDINDSVRDLLVYSTTEAYERLRAKLRLGVGQQ